MWPKALAQLIELAPHVARMLPMADRFFQSKSAEQDASRTAMEQMTAGLRGDLGQVTASHAGLYSKLNEQSDMLAALSGEVRATKLMAESAEARVVALEAQIRLAVRLLVVLLFLGVLILSLLILVLLHK